MTDATVPDATAPESAAPAVTRDPGLDPELASMLAYVDSLGLPPMSAGTAEQAREAFRARTISEKDPARSIAMREVRDLTVPGGAGEIGARLYRPLHEGPLPTVVYFHGGGWVIGDLDTHDPACRRLADLSRAVVLSVDYRLAPESPFPAAVEDAVASTHWAADHVDELGGDGRVAVAGDSAGGNLAAVVAQAFRDAGRELAGQLLIFPSTDSSVRYPSAEANASGYSLDQDTMTWFRQQLAAPDPHDPRISPALGRLDGLAPAVVTVAQFDPLHDDGAAYAERLAAAGVPTTLRDFAGLIHGYTGLGRFSRAAAEATEETFLLFRDVLHP